ncbi:hypothetical protein [Paludisphaera mucosa]|uniref:Uncharacterized protein n=1 Tax=Paludisphaera mucosa TaxID=3030827 RepID=A0ABT6FIE8_9BACT|nr:hypothetical protein [Paludisphaera mucosa]MDG3007350.1 hypothetical protein [Paludisphaera mucosa]
MNPHELRVVESLQAGKVTCKTAHGHSMEPIVPSGSRQTLVPVLAQAEAERLGCRHYEAGVEVNEGESWYITPDEVQVGDPVFCKVANFYTHEVHKIAGKPGDREFYIGRHDKKRYNGWTRKVYGKCIKAE